MTTAYVVNWQSNKSVQEHMDLIKKIHPDKIICLCLEEIETQYLFRDFLDKARIWANDYDKIIHLITPHLSGVYIEDRVKTESSYGYIFHFLHQYFLSPKETEDDRIINSIFPNVDLSLLTNKVAHLYTCYNYIPRPHRSRLVDVLARENLLDVGTVTFHHPVEYPGCQYPTKYTWKYHDGSVLVDDEFERHVDDYKFSERFKNSFMDLVTETCYGPDQFFLTEKTLKSIMGFKPFLTLSCRGFYNDYLVKKFGLEIYSELFDYSFDECESVDDRIEGIVENLKRIKNMGINDRVDTYIKLIPKMVRNKNKIIEIFLDKEKIIPKCLQFITKEKDYEIHGDTGEFLFYLKYMRWINNG